MFSHTVPYALKNLEMIDFADAIFGGEKFWAIRVFFEDVVRTVNKGILQKAAEKSRCKSALNLFQKFGFKI